MANKDIQHRLAAIFVADIVGYSRLMEADEAGTYAMLRAARSEVIDPAIAEHDGRIVKHTGDGFLAEFPTVQAAMECALGIQHEMGHRGADVPEDQRLKFRIGINLGDIIVDDDGDIFGDGVNVAARLESMASPGGICVSGPVYESIRKKLDVGLDDLGEQAVKNISAKVRVYEVRPDGEAGVPVPRSKRPQKSRSRLVVGAASVLSVLVIGGIAWWQPWTPKVETVPVEPTAVTVEGLEVMFFKRPPYHVQEGGADVSGIFADRVSRIMEKAGIVFTWVFKPASWHLKELEENDRPMCISGWFKTPDRQRYSKYSNMIYRDEPFVVFAKSDNDNVLRYRSVRKLVADTQLRFGAKLTFSYGTEFDRMFKEANTIVISTASDNMGMLRMLLDDRFDYTLVSVKEAEELSRQAGELGGQIIAILMPDMPPPQGRYLACTRKVDDALIDQINKAIEESGFSRG